jgi:hypothetical protein
MAMTATLTTGDARVLETIRDVVEQAAVGKVFGTAVVRDGVTVLPVAKVTALLVVRAIVKARAGRVESS